MNSLFWLVTITDRRSTDAFLALYETFGVTVSLRTVGAGTAVRETLSTLGLEQTEKAVLFAMITADTWPRLQKALRRELRIDVPGTSMRILRRRSFCRPGQVSAVIMAKSTAFSVCSSPRVERVSRTAVPAPTVRRLTVMPCSS